MAESCESFVESSLHVADGRAAFSAGPSDHVSPRVQAQQKNHTTRSLRLGTQHPSSHDDAASNKVIRWRIDCVNRLDRASASGSCRQASGSCRQGHSVSFEVGACLQRACIDDRVSLQERLPDRLTKQTLTGTSAAQRAASSKAEGLADVFAESLACRWPVLTIVCRYRSVCLTG